MTTLGRRSTVVGALSGMLLALTVALSGPGAAAEPEPALPQPAPGSPADELSHPFGSPVGANDWSCRPSAARPTPVVLVHGTFADSRTPLDRLSGRVKLAGYCVYSLDYGWRGTQRIQDSARMLSAFVDRVLASTGATKVSMIGHSQGGMMPRFYIRNLGGIDKVDDLVGLAPSNYGTRVAQRLGPLGALCPACAQQAEGSRFLEGLNNPDDSPGDVSYTNVVTRFDQVVVPHTNGYLDPAANVTNIRVQDICPGNVSEHVFFPTNNTAIAIALDALRRSGPANPAGPGLLACRP